MKKLYLVYEGFYEKRDPEAVFSTREIAERVKAFLVAEHRRQHPMTPDTSPLHQALYKNHEVWIEEMIVDDPIDLRRYGFSDKEAPLDDECLTMICPHCGSPALYRDDIRTRSDGTACTNKDCCWRVDIPKKEEA